MTDEPEGPNVGSNSLLGQWLRRKWGLDKWDADTAEILAAGCPRAEEEAALRYGPNWRTETAAYRLAERKRIWGPWHFILKPNAQVKGAAPPKAETSALEPLVGHDGD